MILVTASEMQAMDRRTIEEFGIPGLVLMENAGQGAARFLLEQFPEIGQKTVGVIAGRGNNGGDGFVMARCLNQKGIRVRVYLLAEASKVKGDALTNLDYLEPLGVPVVEIPDEATFLKIKSEMDVPDIWIDAILGTGLNSDVRGYFKQIIDYLNALNKPIFAVDIPSGLNSDTGQICGTCIKSAATATFAFAKIGHMVYPGAECSGNLEIVDIGIPPHIVAAVNPGQFLITPRLIRSYLAPRPVEAHKGTTGHLLVIAGSTGKTGAATMTTLSALRTGAGLVTLAIPESLNPVLESQVLEAMTVPLPESKCGVIGATAFQAIQQELKNKKCLAVGPGIGQDTETKALIRRIISSSRIPMVVDADGLNNIAGELKSLKNTETPIILTPHPGEMARLLNTRVSQVQQDRINCARDFAVDCNVHVILKGARTVIAHPDGRVFINATGNAGMASGGMGDVLTGMIAGLVVQGLSPEAAAHAGVYLHGAAADSLARKMGPFGYLAGDLMTAIPGVIKKVVPG